MHPPEELKLVLIRYITSGICADDNQRVAEANDKANQLLNQFWTDAYVAGQMVATRSR